MSTSFVARNANGCLEAFGVGAGNALDDTFQTVAYFGPWSPWASLGGPAGGFNSNPTVLVNSDTRLEVFARGGANNALWHNWQAPASSQTWSGWVSLGGPMNDGIKSDPAGADNLDGRLEVFVRGEDNALWHIWQTLPHAGPWSPWASLGSPLDRGITSDPAVFTNSDGRLEVFARGADNALWHNWQAPASSPTWSGWVSLGSPLNDGITSDPAVALNTNGHLEVFVRGADKALWHVWQTNPHAGPWSAWASLDSPLNGGITSDPVAIANSDGHLEVFARGENNALWHNWQAAPSALNWSGWVSLGSPLNGGITADIAAADNANGHLEVFALANGHALWHIWQTNPHAGPWSPWASLGGNLADDSLGVM
ncbi:MAG: hypothetical protein ACLQVD_05205 [Capsulimonadaceae bacterium]